MYPRTTINIATNNITTKTHLQVPPISQQISLQDHSSILLNVTTSAKLPTKANQQYITTTSTALPRFVYHTHTTSRSRLHTL